MAAVSPDLRSNRNMDTIILASGSPRRQEILKQMGLEFTVSPQDVDESFAGMTAEQEAERLAADKVRSCICSSGDDNWILGADTFIVHEGNFIGKPENRDEAREMLEAFSGRTHEVITGLALNVPGRNPGDRLLTTSCRTLVTFSPLSADEIEWYLDTGEWRGVAAAYRIQEKAAVFIESISGSWSNVMGLPINTFYGMLRANNFNFRT